MDALAAHRNRVEVADRRVTFLRLGLHGDLVAKGVDHRVLGAQMHDAVVAVDEDMVAIQRLCRDAVDVDHQWNRKRAGHDGGVRPDGPFLQHDPTE